MIIWGFIRLALIFAGIGLCLVSVKAFTSGEWLVIVAGIFIALAGLYMIIEGLW